MKSELKIANQYNTLMQEKVKKSDNISRDLLNKLSYIESYEPVKDDNIDIKLSDFVNGSLFRVELKTLFKRKSQGIYQFGNKNIKI